MFIAEPQILLDKAQKSWDGFVNKAVTKYGELDKKIEETGAKLEKTTGRIGKAAGIANSLFSTGEKILAKYPGHLGDYEEGLKKALPGMKEAATQAGEWAVAGATIGSIIPGIGTGVGALVGGFASLAVSAWDWAYGTEEAAKNIDKANKNGKKGAEEVEEVWSRIVRPDPFADDPRDGSRTASAFSETRAELEALEEQLNNIPPIVAEVQQSFNDWLFSTYDNAIAARKEIAAFNKTVLGELEADLGTGSGRTVDRSDPTRGAGAQGGRGLPPGVTMAPEEADDEYQKSIDLYRDYASTVTKITQELTDQLAENIATGDNLFAHMGEAAVAGVAQVLKQLSKMWGAEALGELAQGIAALANPAAAALTGETAAGHFAAAAAFGAASAATGVGGALLGGAAKKHNIARNAPDSAPASGMGGDSGTKQLSTIVVNFNSTVPATEREAQEAAARVNSLLDKGARK